MNAFRALTKEAAKQALTEWETAQRAESRATGKPFMISREYGFYEPDGSYCLRIWLRDFTHRPAIKPELDGYRERHTVGSEN